MNMGSLHFQGLLAAQLLCCALGTVAVPPGFHGHLRCPFAKVWLEHGAQRAAQLLGVPAGQAGHGFVEDAEGAEGRRLADEAVWGTCNYTNPWAGPMCMELRGASWTDASAQTRCNNAFGTTAGVLAKGARCQLDASHAGWCSTASGAEMTMQQLAPAGASSTCAGLQSSCEGMARGAFVVGGRCAPASGNFTTAAPGGSTTSGAGAGAPPTCLLAPGPIGAAHQMAFSLGYKFDCPDAPAQRSPYMWPLRWTADVEAKSLKHGSDEVQFESRGRVWYMLDKNWKRSDVFFQRGIQRAIGQTPCADSDKENGTSFGCVRDSARNTTVLHRNNKMFFLERSPNGNITNCTWSDLSVIGNIRPDWFMDDRGASTDVQYLGDSHVYYQGQPKLVKQWRKKDFANQYFTMSMQRLPGADGVHWPLILNIPGEGFGDDSLQHYSNHRMLNDTDAQLFLLDEAYEAAGGRCVQLPSSDAGPPTGQQAVVPSNLEVDVAAWRKIVFTASPVWSPPTTTTPSPQTAGVIDVASGVRAEACFDDSASAARVTVSFSTAQPVWAAVGFLTTEECLMTPRGGGDGEMVIALPDKGAGGSGGSGGGSNGYSAFFGPLPLAVRSFSGSALSALGNRLVALDKAVGFKGGLVRLVNGRLQLGFARTFTVQPAALHLSYALGGGPGFSYHATRGCFTVRDLPVCPALACPASTSAGGSGAGSGGTGVLAAGTSAPPPGGAISAAGRQARMGAGVVIAAFLVLAAWRM